MQYSMKKKNLFLKLTRTVRNKLINAITAVGLCFGQAHSNPMVAVAPLHSVKLLSSADNLIQMLAETHLTA